MSPFNPNLRLESVMSIPRITPERVEERILTEQYWQPEGTLLTVCAITLQNGFNVVGTSACVHPNLFNSGLGEELARKDAVSKIWILEGYLLKENFYDDPQYDPPWTY